MIYPHNFESKLGFDFVKSQLLELCESSSGRGEVDKIFFSHNFRYIEARLKETDEMKRLIESHAERPEVFFYNLESWLKEISLPGSYSSALNFLNLKKTLESFKTVRNFYCKKKDSDSGDFIFPFLGLVFRPLVDFPVLIDAIERCVDKRGEVKDTASNELYEVRSQLSAIQGQISRTMSRVLSKAVSDGIVDKDAAPSMRDGRMVIPVQSGNKRMVSGIIHDESASGKTVFIEPAEVVEVSNRLRELQITEQREIVKILVALSDEIRPFIDEILECNSLLGKLDFITAKAKYAISVGASLPSLEKRTELDWYGAVHPVLLETLRQHDKKVVPLNINLNRNQRFLIVSGPNAGGKSVVLKTVGIVQYMMQCGLLPTLYSNSHMGIFKNIFIDIGDEQSIENDLSTYSSHLLNMKYFISHANRDTLVLADEMGSGTEPQIGGALAQTILADLSQKKCFGIVTTHYFNLKNFAEVEPGFVNGSMIYDRQQFKPTFQLSIGSPGSSYALEIATKIGLPREVIDSAKEMVGSEYVDTEKYLAEISRDKKYWQSKRQNIKQKESRLDDLIEQYESAAEELKTKRKSILNTAKLEADEILSSANAKIENTISEIKKAAAEKDKTREIRREFVQFKEKIGEEAEDKLLNIKAPKKLKTRKKTKATLQSPPVVKKELGVGDFVKMAGVSSPGQILSISGKEAEVAFGAIRTKVKLSTLQAVEKPVAKNQNSYNLLSDISIEQSRKRQLEFKGEIDVRGMRGDEALDSVTHFIDDAVQFGAARARILHGTGQGILRSLIRNLLSSNPNVASYSDEDVRYGGAGITVVTLK